MMQRLRIPLLTLLVCGMVAPGSADDPCRCALWIDLYRGEPVAHTEMLDDLAAARVVYLGERHTLNRHHRIQAAVLEDLADRGVQLVVGLEQMEANQQPALDRFNLGAIDFDGLAKSTDWGRRWRGYDQYRPLLETARRLDIPVIALNARAETIRQVFRSGGIDKLPPDLRGELPAEVDLEDPDYEKTLRMQMMVHASVDEGMLRSMVEAQIARDEAMAAILADYLKSPAGQGRTALVICGAGHVAYGLGTAARVERRLPEIRQRIVLLSESGDVELSPEETAMAREIVITHEQLRQIARPIADYLHAKEPARAEE
ncbi:MAG: ChaN family lipoprotein [Rhodopirellula sp.]|nr:ChaN family lipoprotein [Rhodopirellula sp.]